MKKNGFTMIELVFVIVVLGILAAVAMPKLGATRDDAIISKGRSDVAAIRSGIISERQSRIIKGESNFIDSLDDTDGLFGAVLTYGKKSSTEAGKWSKNGDDYVFHIDSSNSVTFTYDKNSGKFTCDRNASSYCSKLID